MVGIIDRDPRFGIEVSSIDELMGLACLNRALDLMSSIAVSQLFARRNRR